MDGSILARYQARLTDFSTQNQQRILAYLALLTARHYTAATMTAVVATLNALRRQLPEARQQVLTADLTQTTPQDIAVFLAAGQAAGLAPATLNTKLGLLTAFFDALCDQGEMARQPVRRQHRLPMPFLLPKPMLDADLIAFFRVIDAVRDRLIFLLMLRCGLRVSEVCALTWDAIDVQAGTMRVNQGKGQVDRIVYLSPDVEHTLALWRAHDDSSGPYLFPSPKPHRAHLFRSVINVLMNRYLAAAELPRHYSPHCLRHTFATQLLNAGVSLEVLKELMGHHSIRLTLRYAQLYDATKKHQYDQAMAQVTQRQAVRREVTMELAAITAFCTYLHTRNYSPHTVENYGRDLRLFFTACDQAPSAVSWRDIEAFIAQQHQAQLAATTINRRLNALKHFFDYLVMERQVLAHNPVKPSHFLRRGRPLPKQLSHEQVHALFAAIRHPMDHALYLLMLRCGLRVSEVARLTLDAIDWEQAALRIVQGKGRKDRIVYVAPDALAALRTCLAARPRIYPSRVGVLESETPPAGPVGQRHPEKDGTLCQSRGRQSQLSQPAAYVRVQRVGRRCGSDLDQGTAGACIGHLE